ncbi:hypothetical protein POM88_016613 [Heracleum sosnowskyi]|uniref:Uncharacterized protein n=1 Tax=Heracleum sosnowskyi TaxID=360622 RepID=A0AAD8IQY5_9APIA|nr:hypothetical protein POM88_016613 [Heracleum sosnowskyi]
MLTNSNLYLHSTHVTTTIHSHDRDYKLFRRRRLKQPHRKTLLTVRNQLSNQSPFDYLVSHINSLDLTAPALEVANDVNEKLVKEDKHYVRIREVERDVDEVRVVYQRKCV